MLKIFLKSIVFPAVFYLVVLMSPEAFSAQNGWRVVWVADGDTVRIEDASGQRLWLRLAGVDTPEKPPRARCQKEADAAKVATAFVRARIRNARTVQVVLSGKQGKYGRELGRLIVDGRDLSQRLIRAGHGRAYDGGKRKGWCHG